MVIFFPLISILILVYSSILHEIMHGYVAYRLGDPTAKLMNRLTLNLINHIDIFMTILLPILTYVGSGGTFIFGGAKPVPVDPFNLRDGLKDFALVSLAGPLTNVVIAVLASLLAHFSFPGQSFGEIQNSGVWGFILATIINWNLLLAILNLIPIPPLDGSRLFALLLSKRAAATYLAIGNGGLGFIILIVLFYFPLGGFSLSTVLVTLISSARTLLGF